MELPRELDDFIRESIDHSLGVAVPAETLRIKLRVAEELQIRLRDQYAVLISKLKEKDLAIERARTEAALNGQAVKRFVEDNKKLAMECSDLLSQCNKLERECSLCDRDREALMDFGNEADERAKEAESRVLELEGDVMRLEEEVGFYKNESESRTVNSNAEGTSLEEDLLETIVATMIGKDANASASAFLVANSGDQSCQKLLNMWNCLKPSTQKAIALAAEVKTLEKEKDRLRINLRRAEEEVKLLFEENNILNKENKKLLKLYRKEKTQHDSGGKHTSSASAKSNKRKCTPKTINPIEMGEFNDIDSARRPLSPLQYNSPDLRMHKKGVPSRTVN